MGSLIVLFGVTVESAGLSSLSFVLVAGSDVWESGLSSVDSSPFDAILIRVVATLAGSDLLDAPSFFVNRMDGDRNCREGLDRVAVEATRSEATLPATDMLSRATSVTAAAFETRGHDLVYQLYQETQVYQCMPQLLLWRCRTLTAPLLCVSEVERPLAGSDGGECSLAGKLDCEAAAEGSGCTLFLEPIDGIAERRHYKTKDALKGDRVSDGHKLYTSQSHPDSASHWCHDT